MDGFKTNHAIAFESEFCWPLPLRALKKVTIGGFMKKRLWLRIARAFAQRFSKQS
jgi:hypothetical protein